MKQVAVLFFSVDVFVTSGASLCYEKTFFALIES